MNSDRLIQDAVETALAVIPAAGLHVRVVDGVVHLTGSLASDADRRQAESLARTVEGVRSVDNALVVNLIGESVRLPANAETATELENLEEVQMVESPEADLNQPVGTTDPLRPEVDPDEPYFPSTDPVIEPLGRQEGGYRVLGGYSEGALDQPLAAEPAPKRLERGDEEIADNVRLALKEDAETTDLDIHVHVRNGVAYLHGKVRFLQDVDAAEAVAGRVVGVREVREQLSLE